MSDPVTPPIEVLPDFDEWLSNAKAAIARVEELRTTFMTKYQTDVAVAHAEPTPDVDKIEALSVLVGDYLDATDAKFDVINSGMQIILEETKRALAEVERAFKRDRPEPHRS